MNGKINPAILMINVHAGCGSMRMPNDIRERLPGDAVHSSASLLRNCLKIIRQRVSNVNPRGCATSIQRGRDVRFAC